MTGLTVKTIPVSQHARDADNLRTLPARLARIKEVLQQEYCRRHNHPWVVAFSGGKDSTLLLQLTWEMMADLPPGRRRRPLIVLGNDTLVESPLVMRHLRTSLTSVATAAGSCELPIETRVTTPAVDQTFWVNVIGRGYIPPTRNFRWCTDRMENPSHKPYPPTVRAGKRRCHTARWNPAQRVADPRTRHGPSQSLRNAA